MIALLCLPQKLCSSSLLSFVTLATQPSSGSLNNFRSFRLSAEIIRAFDNHQHFAKFTLGATSPSPYSEHIKVITVERDYHNFLRNCIAMIILLPKLPMFFFYAILVSTSL